MTGPLLTALSAAPGVRMFVATVFTVDPSNTLTLRYRGGLVPGVARLASYTTPAVGDVVYVLTSDSGTVAVGREELRTPPDPGAMVPPVVLLAAPTGTAVYNRETRTWGTTGVVQTSTMSGVFFYSTASFAALTGLSVATVEIQLELAAGSGPLGFVMISNTDTTEPFTPVSPVYLVNPPVNVPTWVRLPISWATALLQGIASGVGLTSDIYTATVLSGGTLRVTTL